MARQRPPKARRSDSELPDHLRHGVSAEELAVNYLQDRGYRLIKRNFRARLGEIDIIAQQGELLCFVEVRSRRSRDHGDPLETVDRRKQQKIIATARLYLKKLRPPLPRIRFDVVGIVREPHLELHLVQNAFEADSGW